jgi:aspartyl-tRNA(Asn)/glutamyl-tRNA(Gln) amidotransferase subunit A
MGPGAQGTDVLGLSATDLIAAYADRELSPVEVAHASLARIERDDPVLDAFCLVDGEQAVDAARRSEARWARGAPDGALDGVPVGVKDVFPTRGWPTLRGSRAVDPAGPWEDDAPAVAALRRHGAVLPGKTTTPEFGWKGVTDSPLAGITRNPWDPSRTAGGSSGGSSAALAAGMVPLALGTDGGGSIRIPCGFCGLPGIKPTYGRVPAWPASPYGTVAHTGPMARTVADLAVLLDVLSEPDRRDWTALPPPGASFLEGLEDGVHGLRVAFSPDLGYVAVDPEVAAAVERAIGALAALGAHVERADPGFSDPRDLFETLWSAGAARLVADLGDQPPDVFDPGFAALAAAGRARSLLDYLDAVHRRDDIGIRMSRFHQDWDLLVTPTLPLAAFAAGRDVPEGWPHEGWPSWTPFTYPFNLTQQPAASVPCGFTAAGLPIGLQIVGPRYGDALVLRAARAYEAAHAQPTLAPSAR